ncbi:MAG TPA: preprotein translocase subunit SecG [Bacteroidales bacterium]|jgi:preprotein translocase subunit SecG|nr:preprotein translocase subunit SecG [Bacteroidales bacterium]
MYLLISILIIIACILLILIVLVQNSKGGGLASNFASSNQVMGVRKTADFLEKATWTLAVSLLVLSLLASFSIPRNEGVERKSALEEQIQSVPDPSAMPQFPTPQSDEGGGNEQPNQPEE